MTGIEVPSAHAGLAAPDRSPERQEKLPLPDGRRRGRSTDGKGAATSESAPQTSYDFAHNLPVQLTSFIGRDAELRQVRGLLASSRLVTLTGAGGVGKTRLALQVAAGGRTEYPGGTWLANLAPLTDPSLVPVTVARALGLVDAPGRSTMATVVGFIGGRRGLVVLDNCEHLLGACASLAEELLRSCTGLVILATSREPVGAAGEVTWRVPSLLADGAAIELLADRAVRARPGFAVTPENREAVTEICRRLDGIPLAIELAAARLRAFTPAEIAAGLYDRFRLLTGGSRTAAPRQQTLRASVDWSHALLTEPERVLFRRPAAFASGFDLEAAKAVGAGDGLRPDDVLNLLPLLVDKSLVAAEESNGATRYRLPETIRQYAAEKLAGSGGARRVRTRHCGYYTAMAGRLDRPGEGDRRRLMRLLEADIDNLRAAFGYCVELSDYEAALRLASSLQPLWLGRFWMLEGLAWFDAALGGQPAGADSVALDVRVRAVADAGVLDNYTDSPIRHKAQAEDAVTLARQLGNPALLGHALYGAGAAAGWGAEAGRPYFAEALSLARDAGDQLALAEILSRQASGALISGDPVAARSAAEKGLALAGRAGVDHYSRQCRQWLSWALIMQGDLRQARSLLGDLIAEAKAERLPYFHGYCLGLLGYALALMGQPREARAACEAGIAIADEVGLTILAAPGSGGLIVTALASGDIDALRTATRAFWGYTGFMPEYEPEFHKNMAEADLAAGDLAAARQHADQAVASAVARSLRFWLMEAFNASARVATAAGEVPRAHDDACQALSIGRSIESQTGIIDALEALGAIPRDDEDQHKAVRILGAANTLRQATGYQRFLLHQARYDAAIAALRTATGDAAFSQAWDQGAALSRNDAVSYALRGRGERSRPSVGWLSLTPAELDVARLVAEGLSNKEIAANLFVSPRTVQTHLTHIYGKLGIGSRVQLAQQAARHPAARAPSE